MNDRQIDIWLKLVEKHENLIDCKVDQSGKTNSGDGYMGNITFLTIQGKTEDGSTKMLDLVIKSSKESENFRRQVPIQEAFEKEIFVYDQVKLAFEKLQQEKGLEKTVDIIPHCYLTQATGKSELLILENLKPQGYDVCDRKIPMSFDCVKMILEAYGQWHALSLALKLQKPEVYAKLIENNVNVFSEWILKANMVDFMWEKFDKSKRLLIENNEVEVLKKVDFSIDDIKYITTSMQLEEPEYHVILHGDCWTNNFMFKFDENSQEPVDVRIIDWQCAGLGSPVIDLSYFLCMCCSQKDYQDLKKLLKIYHDSLATFLGKLGCDADEIFSFETLQRHWKKYSKYGIVVTATILRFSLYDLDEAPDFAKAAEEGKDLLSSYHFSLKNEDRYLQRTKTNLLHYAQNV